MLEPKRPWAYPDQTRPDMGTEWYGMARRGTYSNHFLDLVGVFRRSQQKVRELKKDWKITSSDCATDFQLALDYILFGNLLVIIHSVVDKSGLSSDLSLPVTLSLTLAYGTCMSVSCAVSSKVVMRRRCCVSVLKTMRPRLCAMYSSSGSAVPEDISVERSAAPAHAPHAITAMPSQPYMHPTSTQQRRAKDRRPVICSKQYKPKENVEISNQM